MTGADEARIQRLTELARQVWPDEVADRVEPIVHDPGHYVQLRGRRIGMLIAIHGHPRALDALEAALLMLAGQDFGLLLRRSSVGQGLAALASDPDDELQRLDDELTPDVMDQLKAWNAEPPSWVEQLAREWEAGADAGLVPDREAQWLRLCAADLRERAKEGS